MTLCLLWENLSARDRTTERFEKQESILLCARVAQFASFHKQTHRAIVLSHLTKVVEGATRTLCSAVGEHRTFWCAGLRKGGSFTDNHIHVSLVPRLAA
jgi:hypothetical protein